MAIMYSMRKTQLDQTDNGVQLPLVLKVVADDAVADQGLDFVDRQP